MCLLISAKPLNVAVVALVVGIVLFINEIGSKLQDLKLLIVSLKNSIFMWKPLVLCT